MVDETENKFSAIQQQIKEATYALRATPSNMLNVASYRQTFDTVSALTTPQPDIAIEALTINGLSAEWLIPPSPIAEQVILYFHSGAYINGSLATDRALASTLAHISQTKILQVAYRTAPEHRFPTAVYDGLAVYQWLLDQDNAPEHIALVGADAGGGIMLATVLLARERGYPLPVVTAGISPWIDLTEDGLQAKSHITTDIMFNTTLLRYAARHYVHPDEATSPLASPLYASLRGLPPLFLLVGEHDIFLDDACQLEERAKSYQVRARCITWQNMFHGWTTFAHTLPQGWRALEQIAAYLEKYFALAKGTWPDNTVTYHRNLSGPTHT